uniref:protein-glutamine gamma-glutamyltransferase K-like n=1 Tax=Myxine glutinosa TaxID=7769 RepID=UPI0035901581
MAGEKLKQEYVLNDTGRIFYGTAKQIGSRGWNYGQFEPGILPICTSLLSGLKWSHRGDTIAVVRIISAMVNSNDDGGILVGRWEKSNSYSGGTAPTAWNGSVEILWQYARTQKPVNYGQCWVFSGLTTTVLRCLGLPCCTVTNFASAHDTDGNLRTDVYVDSKMDMLEDLNRDSIWNFHSWTDVWMMRSDLPPGHDGWQVVDATPQEPSAGMFRCGPASLVAVKNGDVQHPYDTAFIFAEVNSDRVFWERRPDGSMKHLLVDSDGVGKAISTKAVGSNQREDITHLYKYPEGSSEEREAVRKAEQAVGSSLNHPSHDGPRRAESTVVSCSAKNIHQKNIDHLISMEHETRDGEADLTMAVKVNDGVLLGSDFEALVLLSHGKPKGKRREAQVCVRGYASTYTGLLLGKVREECVKINIMPGEEQSVCLKVKPKEYLSYLVDHFSMVLSVSVQVAKTGQALLHLRTYRLRSPRLHLSLPQEVHVNDEVVAELNFLNPIPCHLNDVVLRLEGAGLCVPSCIKLGLVEEGKTINLQVPVVAVRPGPAVLLASLDCSQLPHVYGEANLTALTPQ